MTARFVGGPWDGRVEDYPSDVGSIFVLDEDAQPMLAYAQYNRGAKAPTGEPQEYSHWEHGYSPFGVSV